jgi:hypothetical protein
LESRQAQYSESLLRSQSPRDSGDRCGPYARQMTRRPSHIGCGAGRTGFPRNDLDEEIDEIDNLRIP